MIALATSAAVGKGSYLATSSTASGGVTGTANDLGGSTDPNGAKTVSRLM